MKFDSKLWMLAVALTTVGCQDDLGNDPNNGGGEDFNGPTTYMNISVSSSAGTRANPTGGEEGDGSEPGSLEESEVKDVTVFLFKGATSASGGSTGNYDINLTNNEIAGFGFVSNTNGMVTDGTKDHLWASTVKIKIVDTEKWEGQEFGVLAVTNLGKDNDPYQKVMKGEVTTVQQLANIILPKYKTNQGFVMSTHTMQWGNEVSLVTLNATSTPDNAPSVEVFVERLAAKVRINNAASTEKYIGNYVYAIDGDRVVLEHGAIVNQLTSGSYLLKRTTQPVTGNATATIHDRTDLLGHEWATSSGAGTNFIIEPWSKVKTAPYTDYSKLTSDNGTLLTYDNHLVGTNYATVWGNYATDDNPATYSRFALYNNTAAKNQMTLCYTMENTSSVEAQKNGYSTGVLFQARYYPKAVTGVIADDETGAVTIDYDEETDGIQTFDETIDAGHTPKLPTYYVDINNKSNPNNNTAIAYESYEAILAGYLNALLGETLQATDLTVSKFNSTNIINLKVKDFQASQAYRVVDPFGYMDYLRERATTLLANAGTNADNVTFTADDSFNHFQTTTDFNGSRYLCYIDGVCFYPFWIRHANNGNDNEMGISEFSIVRNNIYDITVSEIRKLGLAGSEVPDPDKDDENKELYLTVNLHVKDWTLRKNSTVLY